MDKYQPEISVDPAEWLEIDEIERLKLTREFHEKHEDEMPEDALVMHCTLHTIVENQIALGVEYVPETVAKLTRQGLDRHEAIHAIGAIICEDIFEMMNGNGKEFSPKKYWRKLDKITAKRWRKGQY